MKALANVERFEPGTNLRAWLFTILRNHYYSQLRKSKREVEDADGKFAARARRRVPSRTARSISRTSRWRSRSSRRITAKC